MQINSWRTDEVLYQGEAAALADLVSSAVKAGANLEAANLDGASLAGASLAGANLDGANLVGASLAGANLDGANLVGANLEAANLAGANLARASLAGANLARASLAGANLDGASLAGASRLPPQYTLDEFVESVVPDLIASGLLKLGVPCESWLSVVCSAEHFECHTWSNCPMAAAWGVERTAEIDAAWRVHADLFIQLFDARLPQLALEPVRAACAARWGVAL
jgi:uncharacterized protein YjbI with pentapeptide repeats